MTVFLFLSPSPQGSGCRGGRNCFLLETAKQAPPRRDFFLVPFDPRRLQLRLPVFRVPAGSAMHRVQTAVLAARSTCFQPPRHSHLFFAPLPGACFTLYFRFLTLGSARTVVFLRELPTRTCLTRRTAPFVVLGQLGIIFRDCIKDVVEKGSCVRVVRLFRIYALRGRVSRRKA